MQIVIDIPEEDFKIMKHNIAVDNPLCPLGQEEMVAIVANGTPLPKGHGNLIDADELLKKVQVNREKKEWMWAFIGYSDIENAPIIIEAESEE